MSMTVKRLILELQKIENQLLEVEVCLIDKSSLEPEINSVREGNKKVLIFTKRKQ